MEHITGPSAEHYRSKKTIHSGHFANLVEETADRRVWVSRCEEDETGALVEAEYLVDGRWS